MPNFKIVSAISILFFQYFWQYRLKFMQIFSYWTTPRQFDVSRKHFKDTCKLWLDSVHKEADVSKGVVT